MDKSKIFSKLLVDEDLNKREFEKIAELASEFIEIQKSTGDIYIKNIDSYTIPKKLEIILVGLWISEELDLLKDVKITGGYIAEKLGEKPTSVSGPLSALVKSNIVKNNNQTYSLNGFKVKQVLKNIKAGNTPVVTRRPIRISKSPNQGKTKKISKTTKTPKEIESLEILEEEAIQNELEKYDLAYEDLESIFYIDKKENLVLSRKPEGGSNKEIHLKSALLYMTGYRLFFDTDEIDSSLLRRQLENAGITGLTNLSTYLKGFSNCIIHKRGEKGNIFTNYKLTNFGYNYGIKLIKDYVKGSEEFDLFEKSNQNGKKRISKKKSSNFSINVNEKQIQEGIDYFCQINNIEKNNLFKNFELKDNNVRILFKIDKAARKHKQVEALLFIGTILKEIYKISKFDCEFLLKRSHQPYERLDLLPTNTTFKKCFSVNNSMREMELNYNGVEIGKKMIIEVCNNGS